MTHRMQCEQSGQTYSRKCPFCGDLNAFRIEDGRADYLEKCEHVESIHTVEGSGKAIQFRQED